MIFSTVYNLDNENQWRHNPYEPFSHDWYFFCCITQRPGHNTKLHPRDEGGTALFRLQVALLTWVQTLTGAPFHSWSNLKLRSVCACLPGSLIQLQMTLISHPLPDWTTFLIAPVDYALRSKTLCYCFTVIGAGMRSFRAWGQHALGHGSSVLDDEIDIIVLIFMPPLR